MIQWTLAEVRRRTLRFVDLPDDEQVEAETTGQLYGAANWYLGSYRSRLEINVDLPVNLASLVKLMCHEAYPGHHTEFTLKEQLYPSQQQIEQSLFLILTPQLVITEGIATLAEQIVFTPEDAAHWLAEQIFPEAGLTVDPTTLAQVHQATRYGRGISGNAWFIVREGRPDDEVLRYVMRYTLWSDARRQAGAADQITLLRGVRLYVLLRSATHAAAAGWPGPARHVSTIPHRAALSFAARRSVTSATDAGLACQVFLLRQRPCALTQSWVEIPLILGNLL